VTSEGEERIQLVRDRVKWFVVTSEFTSAIECCCRSASVSCSGYFDFKVLPRDRLP
jgi:hypothetical protein